MEYSMEHTMDNSTVLRAVSTRVFWSCFRARDGADLQVEMAL
jgi:hypothetical protein